MKYYVFDEDKTRTQFKYCVLVPSINAGEVMAKYLQPFGIDPNDVCILDLAKTGKRTPVKVIKEYAEELYDAFKDMGTEYVICGDSEYYKVLAKQSKADANAGYVHTVPNTEVNIIYVPNYAQVFYDPDNVKAKIAQSMEALNQHRMGLYQEPGTGIMGDVSYPTTVVAIQAALQRLFDIGQPVSCDTETFSLKHYEAGLGTISFALNQRDGFAFEVDLNNPAHYLADPDEYKMTVRSMLRDFFIHFPHKIIFHNASFDVTVLIYQLFMDNLEDQEGMLYGLEVFMEKVECTKIIAYLATNSCAGNTLGLKPLSQEYSGNYSIDEITDITQIEPEKLLEYNLVDCLSTWYVYDKYYPIMVEDNQLSVYEEYFKPFMADVIQMQLTGMPIDPKAVQKAKRKMTADLDKAVESLNSNYYIQEFVHYLKEQWVVEKNKKLKVKRVTITDCPDTEFNPNSDKQLQELLFRRLGLPSLGKTNAGQPSTKGKVIKALKNHTDDPQIISLLEALVDFKDVVIILTTFISAFEKAVQGPSGQWYIFGNFNLGGTVSGRLSSNGPNMQNIPATGSKYAKIIKECFVAIAGWLFVGLDFSSLEDRISALTTKDPQKLKVYTDGYDGHCLRAYSYFGENMPDIDPNDVDSINSIAKKYKAFRQDSKVPTFALTYGGTYIAIMQQAGFPESKARTIETRYHDLYKHSDEWVQGKLDQAGQDGYVTCALGLRLRTPLLKQVIRGNRVTPFEAEAEGRTAGNALGQSWGMLNNRAAMAFLKKVRASKYRLDIRHCAQIHDANYWLIRDDPEILLWMNKHLVDEVKWQNHPDIWHDDVKLGGDLSVFFPSWAHELTLPNYLDENHLCILTAKHIHELEKDGVV